MEFTEIVNNAAKTAFEAGIDAGDQDQLVAWIRGNCRYRVGTEYFMVFLIGSALADLQAQAQGYPNEVARAFDAASAKCPQCSGRDEYCLYCNGVGIVSRSSAAEWVRQNG